MTLSSEMTRLAADFEPAQQERLAAVKRIQTGVRRDLAAGRAALRQATGAHAKAVETDLAGIFSEAAIIRGRTADMIDDFAAEREDNAEALQAVLKDYISGLEAAVANLLSELASARKKMSSREAAARAAYLQGVKNCVQALLADAATFVDGLNKDRVRAGRTWQQHTRAMRKQRDDVAKATAAKPASKAKAKASAKTSGD
ncbi:MAG: hypothetical protein HQ482_01235 [Sphingomonadales bacterium]|nr:hypothetical protein [Sphingomonadales bacterium]